MFAGSTQGSTALSNAGIMHMIVPSLGERDTRLSKLLTLAVKTLEVLMNYSSDMHQSFRDLDGVNTVISSFSRILDALDMFDMSQGSQRGNTVISSLSPRMLDAHNTFIAFNCLPFFCMSDSHNKSGVHQSCKDLDGWTVSITSLRILDAPNTGHNATLAFLGASMCVGKDDLLVVRGVSKLSLF